MLEKSGKEGRQAEWPLSLLLAHVGKPAFMNWFVFPFLFFLTEKNCFAEEKATRWPLLQGHFPLWGDSIGLQIAIIPGQRRDEAGMVHGAHGPLLLILWEVWPRKQQDVREGSAHQHLSLEETRGYPSSRSSRPTWTAEQLHLT